MNKTGDIYSKIRHTVVDSDTKHLKKKILLDFKHTLNSSELEQPLSNVLECFEMSKYLFAFSKAYVVCFLFIVFFLMVSCQLFPLQQFTSPSNLMAQSLTLLCPTLAMLWPWPKDFFFFIFFFKLKHAQCACFSSRSQSYINNKCIFQSVSSENKLKKKKT